MSNEMYTFEFNKLSQKNIELAEKAICSDKLQSIENNNLLSISFRDYYFAELGYKEIIKDTTPNTSYFLFGGNAYGMRSYGLYKSLQGKIYIIDSYMESIQRVFIPNKNIDCFKHLDI
jgi:hypothetical protein